MTGASSRAVVTGGAGFIGSHVCRALLARGWDVVVLDNLLTGRLENVEALLPERAFSFEECDVTEYVQVEGRVDAVLHLASPASPQDYLATSDQDPEGRFARHAQRARIGQGQRRAVPARVDERGVRRSGGAPAAGVVLGQREPGRAARRVRRGEALLRGDDARVPPRPTGSKSRIARIFNTYGPRLRPGDGRVVSNFLVQAMDGAPITIYGDGSQTRSFCYVDDEVRGLLALLDSDEVGPVNIGNPGEFTILELAEQVLARDRIELGDRVRAAPGRRPDPPPTRHLTRGTGARLEAGDRPRHRIGPHPRVVPRATPSERSGAGHARGVSR